MHHFRMAAATGLAMIATPPAATHVHSPGSDFGPEPHAQQHVHSPGSGTTLTSAGGLVDPMATVAARIATDDATHGSGASRTPTPVAGTHPAHALRGLVTARAWAGRVR